MISPTNHLQVMAITVVQPALQSPPGHLGMPDIRTIHRRITDSLCRAKVRLAAGVLEVTLIDHKQGRDSAAWAWCLHGLVLTRRPETLEQRVSRQFFGSDAALRPVRITPWNGKIRWLRHCHKLNLRGRTRLDDKVLFDVRTGSSRACRATKSRMLSPAEKLEILLFHDAISFDDRILVRGAQLRSSDDGCRIVRLHRPNRRVKLMRTKR